MGCQGYLMRYMDETNWYRTNGLEKLSDKTSLMQLMKKYEFYVQFNLK